MTSLDGSALGCKRLGLCEQKLKSLFGSESPLTPVNLEALSRQPYQRAKDVCETSVWPCVQRPSSWAQSDKSSRPCKSHQDNRSRSWRTFKWPPCTKIVLVVVSACVPGVKDFHTRQAPGYTGLYTCFANVNMLIRHRLCLCFLKHHRAVAPNYTRANDIIRGRADLHHRWTSHHSKDGHVFGGPRLFRPAVSLCR